MTAPVIVIRGKVVSGEPALPPVAEQAGNFLRACGGATVAVARGQGRPTEEQSVRWLEICRANGCGQYRESDGRCAECGCVVARKVTWPGTRCPLGLWGTNLDKLKQDAEKEGKP